MSTLKTLSLFHIVRDFPLSSLVSEVRCVRTDVDRQPRQYFKEVPSQRCGLLVLLWQDGPTLSPKVSHKGLPMNRVTDRDSARVLYGQKKEQAVESEEETLHPGAGTRGPLGPRRRQTGCGEKTSSGLPTGDGSEWETETREREVPALPVVPVCPESPCGHSCHGTPSSFGTGRDGAVGIDEWKDTKKGRPTFSWCSSLPLKVPGHWV